MNAPPVPPASAPRAPDRGFRSILGLAGWVIIWFTLVPPGCRYVQVSYSGPTLIVWGGLIALSMLVIVQRYPQFRVFMRSVNPWMWVFLGWCMASAFWSPYRDIAFKQAVLMTGASLIALAFVLASWDAKRLHSVLLPAMFTLVLMSMVVALVDPGNGVEPGDRFELRNAWRGLTYQKNALGQLAAVTLIFIVHAALTRALNPMMAIVAIAVTLFVLLKSRSSTSLMLSCAASGLIMLQCRPLFGGRGRKLLLMPAVGLTVFPLLAHFVLGGLGQGGAISRAISGAFGKDITFSGRTEIWVLLNEEIARHPWTGIGFQSFWHGFGSPAEFIIRKLEWEVPSAHNGYLEIINAVGYIGFAIFLAFIIRHWRDTYRLVQVNRAQGSLHMAFFVYVLFANLSESQWFFPGSFTHIVAMFSVLTVSRMLFQHDAAVAAAHRAARAKALAQRGIADTPERPTARPPPH